MDMVDAPAPGQHNPEERPLEPWLADPGFDSVDWSKLPAPNAPDVTEPLAMGNNWYARDANGDWICLPHRAKVPGAETVTLAARYKSRLEKGGSQDYVHVDALTVDENEEDLGFCRDMGDRVVDRNGAVLAYRVPVSEWSAREASSTSFTAPELGEDQRVRELAFAERACRLAQKRLDVCLKRRAELVQLALLHDGMSQKDVARCLGLSEARVAQLLDAQQGGVAVLDGEPTALGLRVLRVLAAASEASKDALVKQAKQKDIVGLPTTAKQMDALLLQLAQAGYATVVRTAVYAITAKGRAALSDQG